MAKRSRAKRGEIRSEARRVPHDLMHERNAAKGAFDMNKTIHGNRDHGGRIGRFATGCAASQQQARLYSMKDGRTSALTVQNVNASRALWRARCPTGSCTGISPRSTRATRGLDARLSVHQRERGHQRGDAQLRLGAILKCTLARRSGEGFRYGACKDQQGAEYNMIF